eukprot:Skav213674  [mRNA]  locus=scaffold491:242764:243246:- [translate_table: standard]
MLAPHQFGRPLESEAPKRVDFKAPAALEPVEPTCFGKSSESSMCSSSYSSYSSLPKKTGPVSKTLWQGFCSAIRPFSQSAAATK